MDDKHLAWFLGPKAENSELFKNTLLEIIQDYIHWRRNYHPSDKLLITKKKQREHEEEDDKLQQNVIEMMAQLRRNFPFYSPRYIGHMLSDVSMPAMLGYFAGMLYNANNVTTEAAPVTVEWEIEACNEILIMLGYTPSPNPPAKKENREKYFEDISNPFGWSHITSGGTVANIEAIWVARIVKYFPLFIREIALKRDLDIRVIKPDEKSKSIREQRSEQSVSIKDLEEKDVLNIKPNESIKLYAKFIDAIKTKEKVNDEEASKKSIEWLKDEDLDHKNKYEYKLGSDLGKVFCKFPPVIFTSGTAHYSVVKAADILGIGRDNVITVKTDSKFRMDVEDLEKKIDEQIGKEKIPLAVVAIGSTTEEGAVDPVHKILEKRIKFENDKNVSFWLHVDAAWGGYISSLFNFDEEEKINIILNKIFTKLSIKDYEKSLTDERVLGLISIFKNNIKTDRDFRKKDKFIESLTKIEQPLSFKTNPRNYKIILNELASLYKNYGYLISFNSNPIKKLLGKAPFELNFTDIIDETTRFVSGNGINIKSKQTKQTKQNIEWKDKEVIKSFLEFRKADSITVDPHKMGYIQYPCGVIAFKNDRVRHFIMQEAPYVTSSKHNALIHNPPRHYQKIKSDKSTTPIQKDDIEIILKGQDDLDESYKVGTDAFATFILEGSKPGAAAASLWLATKTIPLNRRNHGLIIKSSLLAAQEIYEWLENWDEFYESVFRKDLNYEFMTFDEPDTNVIVFAIKDMHNRTIDGINKLTNRVYNSFTIHAELGEQQHSYLQPFFISKTKMEQKKYEFSSFKSFFKKYEIRDAEKEYKDKGLVILRASIMNPYITSIRQNTEQNLIKEFIIELHKAAQNASQDIMNEDRS